jgi:hypothetical protein
MTYLRFSADQAVSVVLSLTMFGSVVYSFGDRLVPNVLREAELRGFSGGTLGFCLLLATMGLWVRLLYFAGPVAASGAQLQWSNPTRVLARHKALTWVIAVICLLIMGMIAALSARAMRWQWPAVGVAVCAASAVILGVAMLLQRRDAPGVIRQLSGLFLAVAGAVAAIEAWSVLAGLVVVAGVILVSFFGERGVSLGRGHAGVPRWQLIRGHDNRWAVNAGIVMLDKDVVDTAQEMNSPPTRRPLPAFYYRIRRPLDMVVVVLTRLLSTAAISIAGLFLSAMLAHRFLGPSVGLCLMLVAQYRLTVATARCAESWLMSPALQRTWGHDRNRAVAGLFGPVLIVSLLFTVLVTVTISTSMPALVSLLACPALILWRRHSATRLAEGITLISTPAGALPLQTVNKLVAGYDVLAVALLLIWLAA